MKLSIWQQFSSNHSASFTVVGQFETLEAATKAADEFKIILASLSSRYERRGDWIKEATLVEKGFGKQYGFEWEHHLDWVWDEEQLAQVDNYVIVSNNQIQSWNGALYIDKIMEKLGGKVYVEEIDKLLAIEIEVSCVHPEVESRLNLYKTLDEYFSKASGENGFEFTPPWRPISERLYQFDYWETDDRLWSGSVDLSDNGLTMRKIRFWELTHGLPALLEYLKTMNCQHIEYQMEAVKQAID